MAAHQAGWMLNYWQEFWLEAGDAIAGESS